MATQTNRISIQNDLAFKKVFASRGNEFILAGLIQDFTGVDTSTGLTIINPYNIDTFYADDGQKIRATEVDVAARLADGRIVTIEFQRQPEQYLLERIDYYASEKYISNYGQTFSGKLQRERGKNYSGLRPVLSLNFLGFDLWDDNEVIHKFSSYDLANQKYYHSENWRNIIFFELLKNTNELSDNINHWKILFGDEAVIDTAPNYIKIASKILEYQNFTREERTVMDATARYQAKIEGQLEYSWNEGIKEGIITTAKKMILKGFETTIISEVTGLPKDEVSKLKE